MSGSNPPSINGSKNAIYPDLVVRKPRPQLQKVIAVLAGLFFVTTIIFVILFAYYYVKYDEKESVTICNTPDCAMAAATMAKKMNLSVDPCQDFSEYACGRFIKEAVLPEGRTRTGSFSVLSDENKVIMKDIIAEEISPTQPEYLSNMKRLYRSCTDEAKIEEVGLIPYQSDSTFTNDWPTLNSNWQDNTFNLNDLITRYEKVYIEPLFSYYVSADMKDSNKQALYLSDPSLGLSQEYFSRKRNDSVIMAYQRYLAATAVALNATRSVAEQDAEDVVNLEIALSKIMVPREERRDSSKLYNPLKFGDLSTNYPNINITGALRAAFDTANISLSDNETIINRFPTYIGNLSGVLSNFSSRTIQNLFGFKYAISRVGSLTRKMREIRLDFDKVYTGNQAESPRWEVCVDSAAGVFWRGMAKRFVDRTFTEDAKKYMEQMIDNLKEEFRKMVAENDWMGETTKIEAYRKLQTMRRKIGYPDFNFTESDIEKKYEKHIMSIDRYYDNRVLSNKLSNIDGLEILRKPVDKNEWHMSPYEVNAYYSRVENEIAFPAGILQSPFFSQTFQDSMNYGAIGVVIGHEITHGFDDQGSQYDADGNLRNWWQDKDRENFLQRTQCIVNQNSNFHVSHINMNLKGINLQGESTADNGGVKESYRAYKELVRKNGELPILPGLHLTQDQLFFLAYGQLWCEKMTTQRWINQVMTGVHPPGKYRILGPLQNSEDFAKAFNCPVGSYMNPESKCTVW